MYRTDGIINWLGSETSTSPNDGPGSWTENWFLLDLDTNTRRLLSTTKGRDWKKIFYKHISTGIVYKLYIHLCIILYKTCDFNDNFVRYLQQVQHDN